MNVSLVKNILLKPRTIKYKKFHKKRKPLWFKISPCLKLGTSGLVNLSPLRLKSTQLFKITLFLKKAVKKVDKTKRQFWFFAFPHLPLTRKPIGSRMGKGKGKAKKWFCSLHGGTTLIEFLNLRTGRAIYFFKQVSFRIACKTTFLFHNNTLITAPFNASKRMFVRNYW